MKSIDEIFAEQPLRLRSWAARNLEWIDPSWAGRSFDENEFREGLVAADVPAWNWLVDFERRFGGLTWKEIRTCLGVAYWLDGGDEDRSLPLCSKGGVALMHSDRSVWWSGTSPEALPAPVDELEWLVLIGDHDLDTGLYGDLAGQIYIVFAITGDAYLLAPCMMQRFHKQAFTADVAATREPFADTVVEVDGRWGAHMAEELNLELDELASDDVSRFWWDGALCVAELPTGFGRPLQPSTRLITGNLSLLKRAAKALYLRANRGRPRPKNLPRVPIEIPEKRLRVVGFPNKGFYAVCRKLGELKSVGWDKEPTYP